MKILVLSFSTLSTPHFETELEIICNHLEKDDEVYSIHCGGVAESCFFSPVKTSVNCFNCKKKYIKDINFIDKENKIKFFKLLENVNLPNNIKYEFKDVQELKEYNYFDFDIGLGVASSIISRVRDPNFDTKKNKWRIKENLNSSLKIYLSMKKEIEKIKPDLVYLFNGRFAELRPVMRLCEQLNIKFITHERGANITKYDLFENSLPHNYKYLSDRIDLYWEKDDDNKYNIAKQFFHNRRNGIETSWTSFVKGQERDKLPDNFNKKIKNIIIFNSSDDEFSAIDDTHMSYRLFSTQEEAIINILNHYKNNQDIHFYLRVHPYLKNVNNSQTENINRINDMKFSNFTLIPASSSISSYALIDNSDKIITFGSTVGIEAAYANKTSILIGYSFYEGTEAIKVPQKIKELYQMIESEETIDNVSEKSLKYGYWELTRGYNFKYFKADTFSTGKFMGKNLNLPRYPAKISRFFYLFRKIRLILQRKI